MNGNERHLRSVSLHPEPSDVERDLQKGQDELQRNRLSFTRKAIFGVAASVLTVGTLVAVIRSSPAGSYFEGWNDPYAKASDWFDAPSFEPRKDAKPKVMVTHVHGGDEILLRSDAELGDNVVGITKPGVTVVALIGSGKLYPTYGNETNENGVKEGIWYEIIGKVPLYDKVGSEYFPRLDESGEPVEAEHVIVAANFLDEVHQEDTAGLQFAQPNP